MVLFAVLMAACTDSSSSPSSPSLETPPPSTYRNTRGCVAFEWLEVQDLGPSYSCRYIHWYEFRNLCDFGFQIYHFQNHRGATKEDVRRWAADFDTRYVGRDGWSDADAPFFEPLKKNVYCPGGDGRAYVTYCTGDWRDERCRSGWEVTGW